MENIKEEAQQTLSPRGFRFGYRRVSSITQNLGRQLQGVELDRIFEDKLSGKDTNRPQLQLLLSFIEKGDAVYVHSLDRLGRNYSDLIKLVNEIINKGASLHFMKEKINLHPGKSDPFAELQITLFSAFAQFERALIKERQEEGIALAKRERKYKGRQPSLDEQTLRQIFNMHWLGLSHKKIGKRLNLKPLTVWNYVTKNPRLIFLKDPNHPKTQLVERIKRETKEEHENLLKEAYGNG